MGRLWEDCARIVRGLLEDIGRIGRIVGGCWEDYRRVVGGLGEDCGKIAGGSVEELWGDCGRIVRGL